MNPDKKSLLLGSPMVLISSLGPATLFLFAFQAPAFTVFKHAFKLNVPAAAAAAALCGLTLYTFWLLYSRIVSRALGVPFAEVLGRDARTLLPLAIMALAPVTLSHYLGAEDILARVRFLASGAILLVVFLKAGQFGEWRRRNRVPNPAPVVTKGRRGGGRKLLVLFLAALAAFNAGSLIMRGKGAGFSGDEPHYLLMDFSLLHDGDLDLANNYRQKDYSAYMIKPVTIPQLHVVRGTKPGSQYSFHSPGTAFLMLPFYAAGSLFGKTGLMLWLRFGVSLFGALLGLQVYLFSRDEWGDEKQAILLWAFVSLATPVYFYSIHVYPEIFVALFAFIVFRLLRDPSRLNGKRILLAGFLLSTFIWFHALKYIFLAGPLAAWGLWLLYRKRSKIADYAGFLVFPVVITAAYLLFQKVLYGSFSLSAVSWKGSLKAGETFAYARELFTGIPFRFRWETLAGYFFDQKDGLLFYAPIYLFAFLGLLEMARKKTADFLALLFIISPYVLVSAFLTQRTGYAPQARPLVAVIWAGAIGLGFFLAHNTQKIFAGAFRIAAAATLLMTGLLLLHPLSLYQETTMGNAEKGGGIFYVLSNLHVHLTDFLPAYIKSREDPWPANFVWIGIFALVILLYALGRRGNKESAFSAGTRAAFAAILGALFFAGFVLFPRTVLYDPAPVDFPLGEKVTFYSMSRVVRQEEPGKFLLPDDDRAYVFMFSARRGLGDIRLGFGSDSADCPVRLEYFDTALYDGRTERETRSVLLEAPPAYDFKGSNLYIVTIRLGKAEGTLTPERPYRFELAFPD
jgi:hypothetical protein